MSTTAQDNAALVRANHDAWNRRDFDAIVDRAAETIDWLMVPGDQHFVGKNGTRQYAAGWAAAFPDGRIEEVNLIAGDDGAVIEFMGRGTHSGPLMGPAGEIPPTGRSINMLFCEIYRITDGKVTGGATYFDTGTLMQQLGLMPEPAMAGAATS